MKKILIIIVLLTLKTQGIGQTLANELYQYKPNYSDEFNAFNGNLWHTCGWNPQTGQMGEWCQEDTWFINNCVTFSNGKLKITPYLGNLNTCGKYKSGCLTTNNEFLYGYYESSVKLPPMHPLLLNAVSSWWNAGGCKDANRPAAHYNEIDVFETSQPNLPHEWGAVLLGTDKNECGGRGSSYGYHYNQGIYPGYTGPIAVSDLDVGFHVFGLEWTPEVVNFYFDGILYRSISILQYIRTGNIQIDSITERYKGGFTYVDKLTTPVEFMFWVKKHGDVPLDNPTILNPDGVKSLEVEYFKYFKPKPILKDVQSNNTSLTLRASSFVANETYNWVVNSGNLSLISQNNSAGLATFSIPAGFVSAIVSIQSSGGIPNTTAGNSFEIKNSDGNICGLGALGNTPTLFLANNIVAPSTGCTNAFVPFGKEVIFVGHNSVTLNGGFEVVLGASFSAF